MKTHAELCECLEKSTSFFENHPDWRDFLVTDAGDPRILRGDNGETFQLEGRCASKEDGNCDELTEAISAIQSEGAFGFGWKAKVLMGEPSCNDQGSTVFIKTFKTEFDGEDDVSNMTAKAKRDKHVRSLMGIIYF